MILAIWNRIPLSKINVEDFATAKNKTKKNQVYALLIKLYFRKQIRFKRDEMTYFE